MKQEFVTLPREVVEQVFYHLIRGDADAVCWADGVIKPALEQPQRKLTPQDIADSALLGNIESPFNACMHQEHCKRWKAQADQQHQGELSSDNDLQCENSHLITTSSSVPFGYKLVPVEPTVEMMDAGGAATRRCYQHLNKGEVMCSYVYRHMLDAAPQPPTTEQSSAVQQPQVEQEPVELLADAIRSESTELIHKWRVLELIQDHARQQPKRELMDNEARRIYNEATYHASIAVFMTRMDAENPDADDKGVSGWLQEAEDRVKRRTIDAAHEIGQAAAPQQGDQEPVAWLATYTGKVGEPLVYVTSSYELAVENDRNQSPKPLYLHQQNLNCKSNQKRLATLWGYVKAEQSSEVDMKPAAWLHTDGLGGKQAFTDEPPPGLKAKCRPLFARAIEAAHNIK